MNTKTWIQHKHEPKSNTNPYFNVNMNPRRAWTLHLEEPQHEHDYSLKPEPKGQSKLPNELIPEVERKSAR